MNGFALNMSGWPVAGSVIVSGLRTRLVGASTALFFWFAGVNDDDDEDDVDDKEEVDETGFDGAGARWAVQKHAPLRRGDAAS